MAIESLTLFRSGGAYRAIRIPAIGAIGSETVVVVAVGRRFVTDFGPSDLLVRRSTDSGRTWSPQRILVRGGLRITDNPTIIADPFTGHLHLFYQTGYRRLWQRTSTDGGASFGMRIDRTASLKSAETPSFRFNQLAPGPGSGAVLDGGRLVLPVWVGPRRGHSPSATLTLVSDDHGDSWTPGEIVAGPGGEFPNPSEATVAPTSDGGVVIGFRQRASRHRVFARSADGATGWSHPIPSPELFEPVCQATLVSAGSGGDRRIAFINPDSRAAADRRLPDGKYPRENLTLRWSTDDGRRWGEPTVVDAGASGYSSAAVDAHGTVHLVWEHGRLARTSLWPSTIEYARV